MVCKLNKSVYGLVQAAKNFYRTIVDFLKTIGFVGCKTEPCLMKYVETEGTVFVGIYVDDLLFVGKGKLTMKLIDKVKNRFGIRIKMDLDEFIGCQIQKISNSLVLHQARLITKLEAEFGEECGKKVVRTPMSVNSHVVRPLEGEKLNEKDQTKYMSGTGTLLYLVKHSRPDLSNAVRELSKGMAGASRQGYKQMLRVMTYVLNGGLKGVKMQELKILNWILRCYTDSDWAGNAEDRKSVSGWCIFVEDILLSWGSRAQKNVTCSSTEAEYVGISEICKELLFIIYVLEFLDQKVELPVTVWVDNVGAIYIGENAVTKRTKHIDTRYHVIREHIEDGIVVLRFVRSEKNLADIFTKNTSERVFKDLTGKLIVDADND